MKSLEEVTAVWPQKASARTRTIGVALSPCIVPHEIGNTVALISCEDEMEIVWGIHGENCNWSDKKWRQPDVR